MRGQIKLTSSYITIPLKDLLRIQLCTIIHRSDHIHQDYHNWQQYSINPLLTTRFTKSSTYRCHRLKMESNQGHSPTILLESPFLVGPTRRSAMAYVRIVGREEG